jgi:hypothetical protein
MDMELTKKTTILLSPELHRRLTRIAMQRGTSLGDLVRSACEREYGPAVSKEQRVAAVRSLTRLRLPTGSVRRMKREAVPDAKILAP